MPFEIRRTTRRTRSTRRRSSRYTVTQVLIGIWLLIGLISAIQRGIFHAIFSHFLNIGGGFNPLYGLVDLINLVWVVILGLINFIIPVPGIPYP